MNNKSQSDATSMMKGDANLYADSDFSESQLMRADGTNSEFTDGSQVMRVDPGKQGNAEMDIRNLTGERPESSKNQNKNDDFEKGVYPGLSAVHSSKNI